jgi:hypothetical protein
VSLRCIFCCFELFRQSTTSGCFECLAALGQMLVAIQLNACSNNPKPCLDALMTLCSIPVKKDQVLSILVTGNTANDTGPFKLTVDLAKAGSSLATATFLGSDASMEVNGSTQGYEDTYANTRCNGNVTEDGPDVVSWGSLAGQQGLYRCTLRLAERWGGRGVNVLPTLHCWHALCSAGAAACKRRFPAHTADNVPPPLVCHACCSSTPTPPLLPACSR